MYIYIYTFITRRIQAGKLLVKGWAFRGDGAQAGWDLRCWVDGHSAALQGRFSWMWRVRWHQVVKCWEIWRNTGWFWSQHREFPKDKKHGPLPFVVCSFTKIVFWYVLCGPSLQVRKNVPLISAKAETITVTKDDTVILGHWSSQRVATESADGTGDQVVQGTRMTLQRELSRSRLEKGWKDGDTWQLILSLVKDVQGRPGTGMCGLKGHYGWHHLAVREGQTQRTLAAQWRAESNIIIVIAYYLLLL